MWSACSGSTTSKHGSPRTCGTFMATQAPSPSNLHWMVREKPACISDTGAQMAGQMKHWSFWRLAQFNNHAPNIYQKMLLISKEILQWNEMGKSTEIRALGEVNFVHDYCRASQKECHHSYKHRTTNKTWPSLKKASQHGGNGWLTRNMKGGVTLWQLLKPMLCLMSQAHIGHSPTYMDPTKEIKRQDLLIKNWGSLTEMQPFPE